MKSMENPSSAEAVHLAHQAGAQVLATCRSEGDKHIALRAGADEVLLADDSLVDRIRTRALNGVDHVVEVAFAANIGTDIQVLAQGCSIAPTLRTRPIRQFPFGSLSLRTCDCFSRATTMFQSRQRPKQLPTSLVRLNQAGTAWILPHDSLWKTSRRHTSGLSIRRNQDDSLS
jgi:NADPH:quinone reductase-like Zn-dependent oxidoreductase